MGSALFYKEWIKTRRFVLMMFFLLVALVVYTFVYTEQSFRINGHVQMWSAVLLKDVFVLPAITRWFPLLTGLLLGIAQYIPEMTDKRLKLTLHLPLPEVKILFLMLGYGIIVLFAVYFLMYVVLIVLFSLYYAEEIIVSATWQLLPYLEGGLACYLFTAWICMEPSWRQRIVNTLAAVGGLCLFFMEVKPGACISFLPFLTVVLIAGFCFPFYSAARFKEGATG